ncbi:MAG: ACT domain-containing protein [Clostridia bacterium]|nr:ACT domain-containing protein [Clostridia bacterium]
MRAVVTVTGTDRRGVVAQVSGFLFEKGVNIEDVTQTLFGGQFAMMMMVDLSESKEEFAVLAENLTQLGVNIGMNIRIQHADIFDAMHNI